MAGNYQQPKAIADVVGDINSNKWVLPSIQRKFVWDKERIYNLFDSLMRGYPIGTLMVWRVKKELIPKTHFFTFLQDYQQKWQETCKDFRPIPTQEEVFAVIDGQQRLNSIYIGLMGSYAEKLPKKWWKSSYDESIQPREELYININSQVNDEESVRDYNFKFLSKSRYNSMEDKSHWFKMGNILKMKYIEHENLIDDDEYLIKELNDKKFLEGIEENRKAIAVKILKKLYRIIRHEKTINYYQEEIQDLDKVVDIFVRANSGGVPLSFSDLVMSVTVSQWSESRDLMDNLVALIFSQTGISVDRDFILKNCLMVNSYDIKFRVKNFTDEFIQKTKENFAKLSDAITKTCVFVKRLGITDNVLRSKYVLIPIIYYVYKNDMDIDNLAKYKENKQNIAIWLKLALLKKMFGGQPDSILPKLRELIDEAGGGDFPTKNIVDYYKNKTKDISVDEDFITERVRTVEYGSSDAIILLSIILNQDTQHNYSVDHMYPKSIFKKDKLANCQYLIDDTELLDFYSKPENWNTIGNLQLLNTRENESKNNTSLELWIENNPCYDATQYYIPKDEFGKNIVEENRFKEFLTKRRELIVAEIMKKTKY